MLNAVLALNDLDTSVFDSPEPGAAPRVYDNHITVPDAHLLFNGEFKRVGTADLKIVGEDGQSFFIRDYFTAEKRANLMSPEGATLSAHVVEALAGPLAPGQHAQAGGQTASAQPVIGRVDALTGSATVVRNGVSVALNVGDTVRKGDVVQTSGGSSVAIVFADGTTFSLTANARMVLNDFVYNAGGAGNSASISLVQGAFSFVAGQVAKTGDMRVETPVATMGIRGTAVLVEISANDGQTRFSVMVEPDGTTGSFNLYNKTTGALIATVNNSQIGWVVTPAGPLQVVAQQVQKTPGELAQELGIVQQIFTIFNNNQQNPFVPQQQDSPERRGDNPNDSNPQTASGSGGSGEPLTVTVPVTTPGSTTPTNVTVTVTPVGTTPTPSDQSDGTPPVVDTPDPGIPTIPDAPTLNIINGSGTITGTPGNDRITGSGTPDTINAKAGNDYVYAEGGDDTIIAGEGEGNDFYDGGEHGEGGDTIKYGSANGVVFDLNNGTFNLGGGNIVKSSTAQSDTTGTDVFIRVEKIVASPGNDIFILHDPASWIIDAGAGIDIVQFANGISITDESGDPEITNFEIVDLAKDEAANEVYFDLHDFDSIGNSIPLHILGGSNDTLTITNHFGTDATWTLKSEDPVAAHEDFPYELPEGTYFDIYEVMIGDGSYLVYVQDVVQIALPGAQDDQASMAENEVLSIDVLANDMQGVGTTKTLASLGTATIVGPEGVALGTPEILIQNNQIRIAPGTAFDALAEGKTATITIPYTVQTGTGETFVATATVTVTGTNDTPYFTVLPDNLEKEGIIGPGRIDGVDALKLTSQGLSVQQLDAFLGLTEASVADVNSGATNGSAAAFEVSLVAGQTISFSWFFDADDYLPFNDFAFFSVALASDSTEKLSDVSVVRNYGDSGWQVTTFTAEDTGLYRLGFGVANVGDTALNSYLYIGGFTGVGLSLTADEDDAPQVIDLLYGAHDLDASDVLSAMNVALSGKKQSGQSIEVDGAVTINGNNVTIDPTYFSWLSDGESISVFVNYDISDGHTTIHNTATLVIEGADEAPVIHIEQAATLDIPGDGEFGGATTLYGLTVTDEDATEDEMFHVTITSKYGTIAPAGWELAQNSEDPQSLSFDGTFAVIKEALAQGITYFDPSEAPQGSNETVALTVTDADNNSDSLNFIFSVFDETGAILIGTSGKDVLFGTGSDDTFTGGAGADTFVFGDEGGYGSGQDTITDFTPGQDRIALYGYAESDLTIALLDNGNTQISFGEGNTITLSGAIPLNANDFIFHPSNVLVA